MAAENWLLKMEKLLRALECIDAQMVVYATFAFQDPAQTGGLSLLCSLLLLPHFVKVKIWDLINHGYRIYQTN